MAAKVPGYSRQLESIRVEALVNFLLPPLRTWDPPSAVLEPPRKAVEGVHLLLREELTSSSIDRA
ncbi:hypothetical protein HPB47_013492, partial [Ixodes persulcatus]